MPNTPIDIGSRLELLVDGYLIDRMNGASLMLHSPTPQEVSVVFDRPWEGNTCGYVTVIEDGGLYQMRRGRIRSCRLHGHVAVEVPCHRRHVRSLAVDRRVQMGHADLAETRTRGLGDT